MRIEEALKEAAIKDGYKDWNEVEDKPKYGGSSIRAAAVKAMIIYADAKVNEAITDWELANKEANETLDKLRFTDQYNAAYNQAIRDAAESAEIELPNGLLCKTISTIEVNGEEFEFKISINKQSILKLLK